MAKEKKEPKTEQAQDAEKTEKSKQRRRRGRRVGHKNGKKIVNARKKLSSYDKLLLEEALNVLLDVAPERRFDESVEIAMKLGIDPKKQGQALRGAVSLPHGIGKVNRVIAFVDAAMADEARQAGAIEVGGEELAKKITDGWDDFDVVIAHPSMMRVVGKLGRILGPKGKMPTPKNQTVTTDVVDAIKDFAAGKIEYRADEYGNVHAIVGKRSFDKKALKENIEFFIEHIKSVKPAEVKGTYVQKVYLSTTMGPSVQLALIEGGK